MYASVTQFTVPHFGDDFDIAQEMFGRKVLPELRKQTGYEGSYFLRTDRGEGILVILWEDEAAANASESGGPMAEQMELFIPYLGTIREGKKRFIVGLADHAVDLN